MKPAQVSDVGVGRSPAAESQFKGWRNRNRQFQSRSISAVGSKMLPIDNNSMGADNMNATTVAESAHPHGGNGSTAVPQSTQEKSVVGPLMGVFEDLIKSSTPQMPPLSPIRMRDKRVSDTIDSRQMRSKKSRLSESDGSSAPGKRRKGKVSTDDQRWSKRFTWPDELHREFVSAIFDVGLKHSSPSAVMEFMRANPNITSERVKSHLQKYRKNRDKSRKEFMTSYESSLQGFKNRSGEEFHDDDSDDRGGLTGGEAAAFCTHTSYDSSSTSKRSSPVPMTSSGGTTLQMPVLSREERDGPLGHSFDCLMGLFHSLSRQLEASRGSEVKSAAPSAHDPASSQYATQQHPSHQQSIPHSVDQADDVAASAMYPRSSFHEVADTIPHALSEPIPVSHQGQTHQDHHQWQGQPPSGHQHQPPQHHYDGAPAAYHPQKQAPQYHSHNEIPSIPYSPPRSTHVPGKPQAQAQMDAAPQYAHTRSVQHAPAYENQYHAAPQERESTQEVSPPPQQSSASTTKAQKESTIMKQEMRGQRAFQNKMRAMMQNEMNKYGGNEQGTQSGVAAGADNAGSHFMDHSEPQPHSSNEHESPHMTHQPDHEIWNIDNDDDIFDFLMQS